MMKKLILILCFLLIAGYAYADTHTAASCSAADVQTAVTAASDGDTVTIPAGTCTWGSAEQVVTGNKGIIFVGAGIGVTNLNVETLAASATHTPFYCAATSKTFEFSNMTINRTGTIPSYGAIWINGNNNIIKVHDMSFDMNTKRAVSVSGNKSFGVIHRNTFKNSGFIVMGSFASWTEALNFGLDATATPINGEAVYIENNTFTIDALTDALTDSSLGGKIVFRYNTINATNAQVEISNHGTDSATRGALLQEIYNNDINCVSGTCGRAIHLRAGTGIIANNIFSGTYTAPIYFTNHCSDTTASASRPLYPLCNATVYKKCSGDYLWSTTANAPCTPSDATAGTGCWASGCENDGDCSADGKGTCIEIHTSAGTGYPCRDQIGRGVAATEAGTQSSEPIYIWGNTGGTVTVATGGDSPTPQDHIVAGRDYITDVPTGRPGWSQYTCPHPLAGTGSCDSGTAGTGGYRFGNMALGSGPAFTFTGPAITVN